MTKSVLDLPNLIAAWWWLDPSYVTDAAMIAGIEKLLSLGFTACIVWEEPWCNGVYDNDFSVSKTDKFIGYAKARGMYVIPCIWGTDHPHGWYLHDWDETAFRNWFTPHLQKIGTHYKDEPFVIGFMLDDSDASVNLSNSMAEWDTYVRTTLNMARDYLLWYDTTAYAFATHKIAEELTGTTCYAYCQQGNVCMGNAWVDGVFTRYDINYPAHAIGICFDAFESQWTPSAFSAQFSEAKNGNMLLFSYYAWRRGDPETTTCLYSRPEYHSAIALLNSQIKTYLDALRGTPPPPPPPPPPETAVKSCNELGLNWGTRRWVVTEKLWK